MQTENNITGAEFLSDLNVLLSTSVGLNRNVKLALKKLGEHERADQVYIVSINHDMTFTISDCHLKVMNDANMMNSPMPC